MSINRPTGARLFAMNPATYGCPFASPAEWHRVMLAWAAATRDGWAPDQPDAPDEVNDAARIAGATVTRDQPMAA